MSSDHRKLSVFTIADEFAILAYIATRTFPVEERFGLRSQIRRAAVSIPANIVEGCARDSNREHARFFDIAFGSAREAIYLIDLARRLPQSPKAPKPQSPKALYTSFPCAP